MMFKSLLEPLVEDMLEACVLATFVAMIALVGRTFGAA